MNKEDLYYIYRIQYENLMNDLDFLTQEIYRTKISKDKILGKLNDIIRSNYDKTYLLKNIFVEERNGD